MRGAAGDVGFGVDAPATHNWWVLGENETRPRLGIEGAEALFALRPRNSHRDVGPQVVPNRLAGGVQMKCVFDHFPKDSRRALAAAV